MEASVDIGLFITPVVFLMPVVSKSTTGDEKVVFEPDNKYLVNIEDNNISSAEIDDVLTARDSFKFSSWRHPKANTSWKVFHNEKEYEIDRVVKLEMELYARYECSREEVDE